MNREELVKARIEAEEAYDEAYDEADNALEQFDERRIQKTL
tara:strand:+ start:11459 stop:11581 length:123 start_codon:yes stop_codon:yes gene_type:complete